MGLSILLRSNVTRPSALRVCFQTNILATSKRTTHCHNKQFGKPIRVLRSPWCDERSDSRKVLLRNSRAFTSLRALESASSEYETTAEEFKVVTFYHLVDLENPEDDVKRHQEFMQERDVKGRIYINQQGINAQLTGKNDDAVEYARFVQSDSRFKDLQYTVAPVQRHKFPRLSLRYKPNLVSLEGGTTHLPLTDPSKRATKIAPNDFFERVQAANKGESAAVIVDVRNDYEWDAGHFIGAERPLNERFRDTKLDAPGEPLHNIPKDTPILMYCTGGIRCDVYSTVLHEAGFKEMYTIEGGVQAYLRDQGKEEWDGELFVFDDRLATPDLEAGETPSDRVADRPCLVCGEPKAAPPHRNCANVDCNRLFLVCTTCLGAAEGFCGEECRDYSQRKRPMLISPGRYTKWNEYANGLPSVRGDGRARRRRARRERAKEAEIKEAKEAVLKSGISEEELDGSRALSRHSRRRLHLRIEAARALVMEGKNSGVVPREQFPQRIFMERREKLEAQKELKESREGSMQEV
eukprot:gene1753-2414_t